MSLTSCYRYIIELPSATLNDILRAVLSEDEGAGLGLTQHWEDVAVGDYTATVDVRPADQEENPSSLVLTPAPLGLSLHMALRVEARIQEIPALGAIVYTVAFDLPGVFVKTAEATPRLVMDFPGVTEPDLNLSISGGAIPLTPELIEPEVHALYDANPGLGHNVQTGVSLPVVGQVSITTDIHDDEPTGPHITVQVDSPVRVTLVMPGHMRVNTISDELIDSDITVRVGLDVVQADGRITVQLRDAVAAADVSIAFASPNIYTTAAGPLAAQEIADTFSDFDDFVREFPTASQISGLISGRILEAVAALSVPVFTPAEPADGDEIDLTDFTPATVGQQVLALQLEPLGDGTPCDAPDVFAAGGDGFAIAIAAPEVDRMMAPIVDNNLGGHHVEGYDVTVEELTATLADPGENGQAGGHIWIAGQVEVHVDCWSDPEIDFWGPITLVPAMRVDGTLVFTADAGNFGADDPCCGDVDPAQIANLIEGEESTPIRMPTDFVGVGTLQLAVTSADISRAGIVIHGSLAIVTASAMAAGLKRKSVYWITESAGGG